VPEYNSGSGTYFKEKYRVIVILFVRVLPGSSRDFISIALKLQIGKDVDKKESKYQKYIY
jgi:hypothetical protein